MLTFRNVFLSIVVTVLLLSTGCAQVQSRISSPHPLERNFTHRLFTQGQALYPTLRAAAPTPVVDPVEAQAETAPLQNSPATAQPSPATNSSSTVAPLPAAPLIVDARIPAEPSANAPDTSTESPPTAVERAPVTAATTEAEERAEAPANAPALPSEPRVANGLGDGSPTGEILAAAQRLVGIDVHFDGNGFLTHLLQVAQVDLRPASGEPLSKALYEKLNRQDRVYGPNHAPEPGSFVFFHNTVDRDDDGRSDDWFTLVGVVESVDDDRTVHFVAYSRGAIRRLFMNLSQPSSGSNDVTGKAINSLLRERTMEDRPFTAYRSGELFASYGTLN